jgi:hypothetical protein
MADFEYNPVAGWEDETIFPDYPTAQEVRPMLQRLFDQIRDAFNLTKNDYETHKADVVTDADGAHGLKIEEGVFSPTIVGLTAAGTNTYGLQKGFYYVIGNMVHFNIKVVLTAKDVAMAGNIGIGGLPFPSKLDTERRVTCAVGALSNLDLDATRPYLTAMIYDNASYINLLICGDNIASQFATVAQITATTTIHISGSYRKA